MKTKFSNDNLLSSAVLVLNANYSPMTVCTAKRAISLYFLDKIDILSNYDESISSPSLSLDLPSVIKIRTYVKNNNMAVEISRKNVLVRDNYECQYCGKKSKSLTVDHIIPKFRNGQDTWENLVACCDTCNVSKGNKYLHETNMKLRSKPKAPISSVMLELERTKISEWKEFVFE